MNKLYNHCTTLFENDYTKKSWSIFQETYRKLDGNQMTDVENKELEVAVEQLEFALSSYNIHSFPEGSQKDNPMTAVVGEVDDGEFTNISIPRGKGYLLNTVDCEGVQKAVARYTLAKPLYQKVLGFYFRDVDKEEHITDIIIEVLDSKTENGFKIENTTYQSKYMYYPIVGGVEQEGIKSATNRHSDWHKMEYNFTNYNSCQVYMDERLIYQSEDFQGFDTLQISRINKAGVPSTLFMTHVMICDENPITEISLPEKEVELGYFDTYDININTYTAQVKNPDYDTTDKVTYGMGETSAIRVSAEGTIECREVGEGTAWLETSKGLCADIHVKCVDKTVEAVQLSDSPIIGKPHFVTEVSIQPGEIKVLNAIMTPTGVTNRKVNWESSDESIVTVTNGLIKASNQEGEAMITAITADGNKTISCKVMVQKEKNRFAKEFYVAVDGSDQSGDGTKELPFASVLRARDEIRSLKAQSELPAGGIAVYVRGGNYDIAKGICFGQEDAGTKECPIKYMAYPDETVIFRGSINFTAKDMQLVEDNEILEKLPEVARGKVYQIDLSDRINSYRPLQFVGHAALNWLRDDKKNFNAPYYSVTFDGKAQTLSRWPNEDEAVFHEDFKGFTPITKVHNEGAVPRMWADDVCARKEWVRPEDRDRRDLFNIESAPLSERMKQWNGISFDQVLCEEGKLLSDDQEIWMMGYWGANFSDQSIPVHSISSDGVVVGDEPSAYGILEDESWSRFYIYNLIQELDIPGEWYFDQKTFILYLYPPAGYDMNSDVLIQMATLLDNMFQFEHTEYISVDGINISTSLGSAIEMKTCHHIEIKNATISGTQNRVGTIHSDCKKCGFSYCNMYDVNGGIFLNGGSKTTLEHGLNYVEGCHFKNFSTMNKTYNPAVYMEGVGNMVRFCHMEDAPHAAIIYYGNEQLMEFNDIHHVVLESADQGGIYTGANVSDRGCIIRNNHIHDVAAAGDGSTENHGIYLDGNTGGLYIYDNFFDGMTNGIFVNGSRDTIMVGNTFKNVERGVYISDCAYMEIQAWYKHGYGLFGNTFNDNPMPYDLTDENTPYKKYDHLIKMPKDNMLGVKYNKAIDNTLIGEGEVVDVLSRNVQENAVATILDGCFQKNNVMM